MQLTLFMFKVPSDPYDGWIAANLLFVATFVY